MTTENNMQPTGADLQVLIRQYPEVGKILETIILSRLQAENAQRVESQIDQAAKKGPKDAKR
tara:strand:- start:612 stop:797 length:186 start_codon:yes stop_codon:yes gene_type:complete